RGAHLRLQGGERDVHHGAVHERHAGAEDRRGEDPAPVLHGRRDETAIACEPVQAPPAGNTMGDSKAAASTHNIRRKPSGCMSAIAAVRSRPGFHTTVSGKPAWAIAISR